MCNAATRYDTLLKLMRGNESAAHFLSMMWEVAHTWDDLIDRDKPVADDSINNVFHILLVNLPRNEFYASNFQFLNPIVCNSYTNWMIATSLERGDSENEKRIAFILRSSYVDLVTQSAALIGGPNYAVSVGTEIRKMAHSEEWNGYMQNLAAETAARENTKE